MENCNILIRDFKFQKASPVSVARSNNLTDKDIFQKEKKNKARTYSIIFERIKKAELNNSTFKFLNLNVCLLKYPGIVTAL